MIFDPLPRYPRGVRFRLCTHTHTRTQAAKPRPGAGRRRDADEIGISMRVIVGSPGAGQYRVFSSVREHSKHRATMAQNGRQLPDTLLSREPPSLSLSICLSVYPSFSLSLPPWRDKVEEENEFIVGRVKFWWKIFSNVHIFNEVESAKLFPSSRADSFVEEYLLVCLFICCVSTTSLDFDTRWHFRLFFIYIDFIKIK